MLDMVENAASAPEIAEGTAGMEPADEGTQGRLYSQEEVNGIAAKECARATSKLLRELGFDGDGKAKEQVAAVKQKLDELRGNAARAAEQSGEAERLRGEAAASIAAARAGILPDFMDDAAVLAAARVAAGEDVDDAMAAIARKNPAWTAMRAPGNGGNPPAEGAARAGKDVPRII